MAGDQPVEQMLQRRELLLDALGLVGMRLELDPGRDVQRLDVEEVLDPALGLGPVEKISVGAQIRLASMQKPRDIASVLNGPRSQLRPPAVRS